MSLFRRAVRAQVALPRRMPMPLPGRVARPPPLLAASARPLAPVSLRHMQTRAVSTNSGVPKLMMRMARMPMYGLTAAGGLFAYSNYKFEGVCMLTRIPHVHVGPLLRRH